MAEWVHIGTEQMQAAQDATGLSNERLAPKLHITSKTWERWKARGAVQRRDLPRVAEVLGLQIETPAPVSITVPPEEAPTSDVAALAAEIAQLRAGIQEVKEALGIGKEAGAPPQPRRAVNGDD